MLVVPILAIVLGICAVAYCLTLIVRRRQSSSQNWLAVALLGIAAAGLGLWAVHLKK